MFLSILSFGTLPLRPLFETPHSIIQMNFVCRILNICVRMVASGNREFLFHVSFLLRQVYIVFRVLHFSFVVWVRRNPSAYQRIKHFSYSSNLNHRPSVSCGHFVICFARWPLGKLCSHFSRNYYEVVTLFHRGFTNRFLGFSIYTGCTTFAAFWIRGDSLVSSFQWFYCFLGYIGLHLTGILLISRFHWASCIVDCNEIHCWPLLMFLACSCNLRATN